MKTLNFLISQRIDALYGKPTDVLESDYTKFYNSLGINIYPVSNFSKDLKDDLANIEYNGLILSGGGDLGGHPERDRTCSFLIDRMMTEKLPVIGICYGMHLLNHYFGGELTVDVHKDEKDRRKPGIDHEIVIEKGYFSYSGNHPVNHYHNHGIREEGLADCLEIFAMDKDFDVVEGIIHENLPIFAIQWHPERVSPEPELNEGLIKEFLESGGSR
ncbi:gamma-glutamyl-gamma-aminobutyrate hydrolase family protein [Elusimicrobiota bacterium]